MGSEVVRCIKLILCRILMVVVEGLHMFQYRKWMKSMEHMYIVEAVWCSVMLHEKNGLILCGMLIVVVM